MRTRTTSAFESNNARLGEKITGRSNFFKFAKSIIVEEGVKFKKFRELLRSGGEVKYTPKQTVTLEPIGALRTFLTCFFLARNGK